MEEYERQNGPPPGHEKVGGWLRSVGAACESDGPSPYPTPPAAPRKDQYVPESDSEYDRRRRRSRRSQPMTRIKDGELYVRKDYEGRLPLCCYVTGLQEDGPDDFYPCYTKTDIMWARRVMFHNERPRDS